VLFAASRRTPQALRLFTDTVFRPKIDWFGDEKREAADTPQTQPRLALFYGA
jgi:hypothetical protein